jgi:urate oxidase
MSRQIVGDDLKSVGGKSEETVTGHKQSYAGDYNEVKSSNGSVKLTCQNANMTFDAGSNTIVVTCDSMEVSGNSDNAVLYSPLQSLLNTFLTNYSVHTHEVATTGTAVAQSGMAAPPIDSTSSLTGQLQQLQSQKLKLGG